MPEPETERPPLYKTPPPFLSNPGIYGGSNTPTRPPPKNKHGRINTEAEERTAMIIGIVAGALIAVILVILLVLWIKSNGDRSYKMEHDLKYGHGANAALLGHNAGHSGQQHGAALHGGHQGGMHGNNGPQHQQYGNNNGNGNGNGNYNGQNYDAQGGQYGSNAGQNGSRQQQGSQHSDRGAGLVQPKAKRNSKDIKEWYV
jgi:neurexin